MSKLNKIKIPVEIKNEIMSYKLVRHDGLKATARDVRWVEFDKEGRFKKDHKEPQVGFSLILSPFSYPTWQTTEIIEIIEEKENYVKFKTLNSVYELFKIK
jgi:hypothetical protein